MIPDGHVIFEELTTAFDEAKKCGGVPERNYRQKGVSFMEDNAGWHGKAPSDEEPAAAIEELGGDN